MKNELPVNQIYDLSLIGDIKFIQGKGIKVQGTGNNLPEILFITTYPPCECGTASYSMDLVKALTNIFNQSFTTGICPIVSGNDKQLYKGETEYFLNTDEPGAFIELANKINADTAIRVVMIQHEFSFFENIEMNFQQFLVALTKPVVIVFHTILPKPGLNIKEIVQHMSAVAASTIVMTHTASELLANDYGIPHEKITVIPYGTHLVPHIDKELLKIKYGLQGKMILATFGLLHPGKNIETTLYALPAIIKLFPETMFLIIGKTHPGVIKKDGYEYHNKLDEIVRNLNLQNHVQYINYFLPLQELLEYLQLTDIYLLTSTGPNQAASGTLSYALSCGCPVISTPVPQAVEFFNNNAGIIIDFEHSEQLTKAVVRLMDNDELRKTMRINSLYKIAATAWENVAIAHALLFEKAFAIPISLDYNLPPVNPDHLNELTTGFGMVQFSKINQPDTGSGYTLDDNACAMIALCQHFEMTKDSNDLKYISIYFNFIKHCLQPDGYFLNYVNREKDFTDQNYSSNLADSNGKAIWALGYLISTCGLFPKEFSSIETDAESILQNVLLNVNKIHSAPAMGFVIKGLYYRTKKNKSAQDISLIKHLANKLVQMYRHEAEQDWQWFESYLTCANSILPEAMLCAWQATGEPVYKEIAKTAFDFLLTKIFSINKIKVIPNKGWMHKGKGPEPAITGGEQPKDVSYTILALRKFHDAFNDEGYLRKMKISFNWFLGSNHLNQVIYNPGTGGCYDSLEENYINMNQGAESSVSYLMARLAVEKATRKEQKIKLQKENLIKLNLA